MATNYLQKALETNKISLAKLSAKSGVDLFLLKSVFAKKRTLSPTTQRRIVGALNSFLEKQPYQVVQIFPDYRYEKYSKSSYLSREKERRQRRTKFIHAKARKSRSFGPAAGPGPGGG